MTLGMRELGLHTFLGCFIIFKDVHVGIMS